MQIFIDESGTVGSGRCVVAAALIDPSNKHIRRALKGLKRDGSGEIKGSVQTPRIRTKFFASLPQAVEASAVVVGDADTARLAGALGLTEKVDIYAWAAMQTLRPLIREGVQGITLDSSPYKQAVSRRLVAALEAFCGEAGLDLQGRISHGDSRRHEGLQVADVLANSVYGENAAFVREAVTSQLVVRPLADAGKLHITTVRALYEAQITDGISEGPPKF